MRKIISVKDICLIFLVLLGTFLIITGCIPNTPSELENEERQLVSNTTGLTSEPHKVTPEEPVNSYSTSPTVENVTTSNRLKLTTQSGILEIELENTAILAGGEGEGGGNFFNPVWSHDGSMLAYKHNFGIWVVNTETWENPRKIYDGGRAKEDFGLSFEQSQNLVWSPDDRYIGFTLLQFPETGLGAKPVIGLFDLEENQATIIEDLGVLVDWGKRGVVACKYDEGSCVVADLEGKADQELGNISSPFFYNETAISYANNGSITIKNLENGTSQVLEDAKIPRAGQRNPYSVGSVPAASPDGSFFVWTYFETNQDEPYEKVETMWLYDVNRHETIELLTSDTFPSRGWSLPGWSPDSQKIAFLAGNTIWVIHLYQIDP